MTKTNKAPVELLVDKADALAAGIQVNECLQDNGYTVTMLKGKVAGSGEEWVSGRPTYRMTKLVIGSAKGRVTLLASGDQISPVEVVMHGNHDVNGMLKALGEAVIEDGWTSISSANLSTIQFTVS
jgi:hypothetical protein